MTGDGAKSGTLRDVKVYTDNFRAIAVMDMTAIVRMEDEDTRYQVGDLLKLREWSLEKGYTGSILIVEVTHCQRDKMVVVPGSVILSIRVRLRE